MKAVICPAYGPPEVLEVRDIPKPSPKKNELLVKVMASAVNSGDVRIRGLRVEGFMRLVMRLLMGYSKPKRPILGITFAGIIEEVGESVTQFKKGQKIYGSTGLKQGCHAEYMCISEKSVISDKHEKTTFEEAAALPFGGQTAIYFLRKGKIAELNNTQVLVYGATGSVGVAAIQIAKHYGAQVTAVCSSKGEELAKSLGADKMVLYDKEDFTQLTDRFDIILDAVGHTNKKQCAPLLKPQGKFLTVEGMDVAAEKRKYLEFLTELVEKENYKAVVDKVFPIEQVQEAHHYVDSGRKKGNVVLKLAASE